ncbi:MAG: hypothetical protein PVJ76_02195 [Gemmatimonadota bacterium]|jgi:hypothetical protein
MKTKNTHAALTVLGILLLAGCQDGGPAEPRLQDLDLELEDQIALELLADPATSETALELAGVQTSAAQRNGWAWGSNQNQRSQAQQRFREAEEALAQGDQVRAMERAREGRQLVAQAIELAGGPQAIVGLVEHLEALPAMLAADPAAYVNAGKLGLQIGQVAERARNALQAGDRTRAGALGVLGEQAFRHSHQHQYLNQLDLGITRAELAIDLGAEAIGLAEEILNKLSSADTESQEYLNTAGEFLAQAEAALETGEEARAAHLAHLAQWWALKAVVLPGGITDEEARFILGLAETSLADAKEALSGVETTALQAALLERAERLLERGKEKLGNGECRGLGALWQSAVISSYLLDG